MFVDQYKPEAAESIARQGFEEAKLRLEASGAVEFLQELAQTLGEGFDVQVNNEFTIRGMPASVKFVGIATTESVGARFTSQGNVQRVETLRQEVSVVASPHYGGLNVEFGRDGILTDTGEDGNVTNTNFGSSSSFEYFGRCITKDEKMSLVSSIVRTMRKRGIIPEETSEVFREFCVAHGLKGYQKL